jgi:hypothetical protein
MMRVIFTPDYITTPHTLCWKRRDGTGKWGRGVTAHMTNQAAERLAAYLDREFPDFEHWTETATNGETENE